MADSPDIPVHPDLSPGTADRFKVGGTGFMFALGSLPAFERLIVLPKTFRTRYKMSRQLLSVTGDYQHETHLSHDLKSQTQYKPTAQILFSEKAMRQNMKPTMDTQNSKIRPLPLITWLGGPYAILLQLSHPAIASASCAHSRFVVDALSRLRRTAAYIVSLTHGTEREQLLISGMISRQHAFIKSRNHKVKAGNGYDARDPELQKWVAATLFKGIMVVDEVFSSSSSMPASSRAAAARTATATVQNPNISKSWKNGLDSNNSDRSTLDFIQAATRTGERNSNNWLFKTCQYLGIKPPRTAMCRQRKEYLLQEAAHLATSLDMPHEMWFSSLEEFDEYFEDMITRRLYAHPPSYSQPADPATPMPGLSETSKKMGQTFLYDMKLPFWLLWLPALMRLLARAWLPNNLRREFGLGSLERKDLETDEGLIWTTVMRWTYITFIWFVWLVDWFMPVCLEEWIVGFMARDMQFAADEIERTGRWPM